MTLEEIRSTPAIDFHAHFGNWNVQPQFQPAIERDMPGSLDYLLRNKKLANIALSIGSHLMTLMPKGGGSLMGNEVALADIATLDGVLMYAVLNPLLPGSFEQTARLLQSAKCIGIKIHPELHCYPITRHGDAIYEFAARHGAMIITHSGETNSLPEDFCVLANRYPEVRTIIAHMGCGWDGDRMHQARAIERNVNDNLFTDTSSSFSILSCLLENYVREIGSDKILFGTDSGCYASPAQRARVDCADLADDAKLDILYRNGLRIFPKLAASYEKACVVTTESAGEVPS